MAVLTRFLGFHKIKREQNHSATGTYKKLIIEMLYRQQRWHQVQNTEQTENIVNIEIKSLVEQNNDYRQIMI